MLRLLNNGNALKVLQWLVTLAFLAGGGFFAVERLNDSSEQNRAIMERIVTEVSEMKGDIKALRVELSALARDDERRSAENRRRIERLENHAQSQ